MKVEIVVRPEMKAAVLRVPRDGSRVRQAWKEVEELLSGHPAVDDGENGFVFIPEWQWATEVTTLWVGMKVNTFESLPEGLETIEIPAKRFAKVTVRGDRSRMDETYGNLFDWFSNGPYERDVSEGSYGYEMNRLRPVNPFDIPADEIDYFDFDIYAPIKEDAADSLHPAYPGIIGAEVRKGRSRKMVGIEEYIDRKLTTPEEAIPRMWRTFMPRIGEISGRRKQNETIGFYWYEPPFGPGQDFVYFAGVEVEEDYAAPLPEGMSERTIPDHDCLAVTYRGNMNGYVRVWDYFHGVWFPQQTDFDAVPDYEFERYDGRFQGTGHAGSEFELHFPLRKRQQDTRLTDKIVIDEKGGHVLQDLRGERLRMVSLQGATLHGIDMRDARLRHVNFVNSEWEHIYFSNVRLNMLQMGGTVFENIKRPDFEESRFDVEPGTDGWVNVEPVIFRDSDLRTARFENCDLRDVDLKGCRIDGMKIDGIPVSELLARFRNN
ncbi:effector binding domain-containing protein [Paenibacillus sp. N4]|uniref:effector binding domain-containing protein n=1 Tax=Paenibacillus vietnamensis TaxID=2590547 RepID=UPI001CD17DB6|nr:effector binding domain-containing protein [Paenibacillus vietnamensis]MCA0756847.1 effector binding domain-containing protein [Paenibacillus vietnamensis]